MKKEITIAYGREIQLTTAGKKNRQVFLKFSPAFKDKQLRELKGASLSVFLCYALHSNDEGYCWVDGLLVEKETGYSKEAIIKARKILKDKGYLFYERLNDDKGMLRDWIYRVFQPIEEKKIFIIRGIKLKPKCEKNLSRGKPEVGENTPIIEEEPIIIKEEPVNNKQSKALRKLTDEELDYKKQIDDLIDGFKTVNPTNYRNFSNKTQREAMERLVKKFGVEQIKKIIDCLPKIFGQPYAPRITTPYSLEQKMADLIAYNKQESELRGKIFTIK